jgi:hypothetical protein
MLRLRKLKEELKRLEKYGLDVDMTVESCITLLIIALVAHVLACLYFMVGEHNEEINGVEVLGWVQNPETGLGWHWIEPGVGTQYTAALAMAMRQEWLFTDDERLFSVFAALIVGVIYGAIDGLVRVNMWWHGQPCDSPVPSVTNTVLQVITFLMNMNAGDQTRAELALDVKVILTPPCILY